MIDKFNYHRPSDPRLKAIPDPKDPRDFEYRKITTPISTPSRVDYEGKSTSVKDQGQRGTCVGFSSIGMKEQHWFLRKGKRLDLSEEFVYDQIMQPGGGAFPRDAMKIFTAQGAASERILPYDELAQDQDPIQLIPTTKMLRSAAFHKSTGFARLHSIQDMELSLFQNGSCIIGVDWMEEWFEPTESISGYPVVRPNPKFSVAGGHALCIVGYDKALQMFKVKNSWGKDWGKNGFFYMSYDAVSQNLNDAWTTFDVQAKHINTEKVVEMLQEVANE